MSRPTFDELLPRLVDAGVDFSLVRGLAVNAWGVVRGTKAVDIVAPARAFNEPQRGLRLILGHRRSIRDALGCSPKLANNSPETDTAFFSMLDGINEVSQDDADPDRVWLNFHDAEASLSFTRENFVDAGGEGGWRTGEEHERLFRVRAGAIDIGFLHT